MKGAYFYIAFCQLRIFKDLPYSIEFTNSSKYIVINAIQIFYKFYPVNKMLKTPKKMFTITHMAAGGGCSLVVNLKLKINIKNY